MLKKDRYISRGIIEKVNKINPITYLMLWELIDNMSIPENEKDYLQVFTLSSKQGIRKFQRIEHFQEEPPYLKIHTYYTKNTVDATIFVIDDGEQSTMLLAEEY